MQRKIIAVLLIIILVLPFVQTASADSSGLCFTATNDNLLDLDSMAVSIGGITYVPANVFSAPYGIYFNYFDASSTALLYNSTKQVFFELSSGNSYDSLLNEYSASATFKNGQVYVPVKWVCDYFGLYCSYISGNGNGDVIRIKNGSEVLTDSDFLNAASSKMKSQYNLYYGIQNTASPAPIMPEPSGVPKEIEGASVSLSFIGLPSEKLLTNLDSYGADVCFFVTADDVKKSPDTIRRICGSGHSIGIYCSMSPENECEEIEDLIFEAAQTRPILITSPTSIAKAVKAFAENNGYAYFQPAISISDAAKNSISITSKLKDIKSYTSVLIPITTSTDSFMPYVFQYILVSRITVLPLRETLV